VYLYCVLLELYTYLDILLETPPVHHGRHCLLLLFFLLLSFSLYLFIFISPASSGNECTGIVNSEYIFIYIYTLLVLVYKFYCRTREPQVTEIQISHTHARYLLQKELPLYTNPAQLLLLLGE